MPESLNSAGYKDLRQFAQSDWVWVSIIDDTGSEITRINVETDSRASWSSDYASNPLTAEIVLHGDDSDIDVQSNGDVTISESASYKTGSGGDALGSETFPNATLSATDDEVTINHKIRIPP